MAEIQTRTMDQSSENWTGVWYLKWPDGSISIAVADSLDKAVDLFDTYDQVVPEMVRIWTNPSVLIHMNLNTQTAMWDAYFDLDTSWYRTMREIAPEINRAEAELRSGRAVLEKSGVPNKNGREILAAGRNKYIESAKKEYDAILESHRSQCRENRCASCLDDFLYGSRAESGAEL